MSKRQLHPLKTNPKTGEPYLQLPAPHENIIITLPRLSDAHRTIELHNDPGIYKTLTGPPFPYLMEHAETWQSFVKEESDNILHALGEAEAQGNEEPIFVNGCPIRALREVQDDGTDLYLGDIFIHRCIRFDDLRDAEQEKLRAKENMALPIGDPNIIWDVGGAAIRAVLTPYSRAHPFRLHSPKSPEKRHYEPCLVHIDQGMACSSHECQDDPRLRVRREHRQSEGLSEERFRAFRPD